MKLLINCACNNHYFHYLEGFLSSMEKIGVDYMVRVKVINVPSYKVNWLQSYDKIHQVLVTKRLFGSLEEERGYCTNRCVSLLKTSFSLQEYTHYAY